jgi:tRNA pseudouridine55 synthase
MLFGALNINKPESMTSRDVVNHIVRACPRKTKVGHAGTLDPMATGVLLVAIGPATKLIQYPQRQTKTYVGYFRLGFQSDTLDDTGKVSKIPNSPVILKNQLQDALVQFTGTIEQTPPQFSAVKVNGERAYKAARAGRTVKIEPRKTRVDSIDIVDFDYPDFGLRIKCGKGTYVRTLGSDIAQTLCTDAIMTSLTRTGVGNFKISASTTLEQIDSNSIARHIMPARSMASDLSTITLGQSDIERLRHGKLLDSSSWHQDNQEPSDLAAVNANGDLVAILEHKSEAMWRSKINFVPLLSKLHGHDLV